MRIYPSVIIFSAMALSVAPAVAAPIPMQPDNTDTSVQKSSDPDTSSHKPVEDPSPHDDPDHDDEDERSKGGSGLSKGDAFNAGLSTATVVAVAAPTIRKYWDEHKPDWVPSKDSELSARGILGGIVGAMGYDKAKEKWNSTEHGNSTWDHAVSDVLSRNFDDGAYEERDIDDLD